MALDVNRLPLSEQTEQVVREYFESRSWSVTKLKPPKGGGLVADFRICDKSSCILCEVKTIESVRANLPWSPLDSFLEERTERRTKIEAWIQENPGEHLLLHHDEWEFNYGDDREFTRKYSKRKRNTESSFDEFEKSLRKDLLGSVTGNLPYRLRLDSDDLYVPTQREQKGFVEWLANELRAIDRGNASRDWHVDKFTGGQVAIYSTSYPIHRPTTEDDSLQSIYHLHVMGPNDTGTLEISIFSYGGLNLERVNANLEGALGQLKDSALREKNQRIPRIVVLAFEGGLGFERSQLLPYISEFFKNHRNLSAVAILDWVSNGVPPSKEESFLAWWNYVITTPTVSYFLVFHNRWIENVEPLPGRVFGDDWSIQLTLIK